MDSRRRWVVAMVAIRDLRIWKELGGNILAGSCGKTRGECDFGGNTPYQLMRDVDVKAIIFNYLLSNRELLTLLYRHSSG